MTWRRAGIALVLLVAACGGSNGDDAGPSGVPEPGDVSEADVAAAAQHGADYLAAHLTEVDWGNLSVVDLLGRNWGIDELAGARPLGDDLAEQGLAGGDFPRLGRLLRADHPTPEPLDDVFAATLYCDRVPLTESQIEELEGFNEQGGYLSTHVGLAAGWMRELGCPHADELADEAAAQVAEELDAFAEGIADAEAGAADTPWLTDLALEEIAVLGYLGDDTAVTAWAPYVAAEQQDDGGWLFVETGDLHSTHTHPSIVATWVLLQASGPGAGQPLVVAA